MVTRSRVVTHRLVVLNRSPLCVHRDLGAVEASMKGGGHEAGSMAHRRNGRLREQVHESLLIRGLDCEDVNERDQLGVVRERHRRLRRLFYLSSFVRNKLNDSL